MDLCLSVNFAICKGYFIIARKHSLGGPNKHAYLEYELRPYPTKYKYVCDFVVLLALCVGKQLPGIYFSKIL